VYSGIARVMSNIQSLSYLWNEVRVQGGAYGAGLNTSETGRMVTYSYRDPSPARTLGINRSMSKGLRDFVAGDERIDKYIISTVGESEPPLGSENQILVSEKTCCAASRRRISAVSAIYAVCARAADVVRRA